MNGPTRSIGVVGGIALVVGITIGSGIFRTPGTIAGLVPDPRVVLALWTGFGLVSLCGALALAELASMMPQTGGVYVFLRAAYGDASAFVFGWLYLLVAGPAAIGALSAFLLELGSSFFPGLPVSRWIAVAVIVLLTGANLAGLRWGTALQVVLTVVKTATLVFVMVLAFFSSDASTSRLAAAGPVTSAGIAAAMASILWTYDGWVQVSLVAGEVVAAERRLKGIIVGGLGLIVALYVGANLAYALHVPPGVMAGEKVVAARVAGNVAGEWASTAVKVGILASVLGALCGNVLARPRVSYALAQDGLAFSALGRLHPKTSAPYVAILVQGAVAAVLVGILRDFDTLIAYFVVAESLALLAAVAAVFVLRRRLPDLPRPFRVPAYPWIPLVFLAGMTAGLGAVIWGELKRANYSPVWGLAIVGSGFPVFWIWRRLRPVPADVHPGPRA